MDFILLDWFVAELARRDRNLLMKLAQSAEREADATVVDIAKEQVLRAVAERLRTAHAEELTRWT